MSLVGRTIGRYRITHQLGEGGMGVVYRAQDSTLGRDVAIKVLRPEIGRQPERVRRFSQEARAASALNHPNIVTVHDAGEFEDGPFLVMELVEGESLRASLRRGSLPLAKVLDIAIQAAAALTRAHEGGITHRDLKPENILVRPDGYIKILDFGLAKLKEKEQPAEGASDATTIDAGLTSEGSILGTAAYMSPEQATGRPVDGRSDIFSLALLLFECWQGHHPFLRENILDTLHAIAHDRLPALAYPAGSPEWGLARMLEKALEKELDERYQTMKDLGIDLRRLRHDSEPGKSGKLAASAPSSSARRWSVAALVAVGLAVVAAGVAVYLSRRASAPAAGVASVIKPLTSFEGWEIGPSWSPDGTLIAYSHNREGSMDVFVMPVGGGDPVQLTKGPADEVNPRWSPDGRNLAFVADRGSGANVYLIPPLGGAERKLAETGIPALERFTETVRTLGATPWSPDGQELLYSRLQTSGEITVWRVSLATGGQTQVSFPPPGADDLAAAWSFDGEQIVFIRSQAGAESLWIAPARGGQPRLLFGDGSVVFAQPAWSADSRRIVFISKRAGPLNLWEIAVDSGRLRQVTTGPSWDMFPVAARDGRLAYVAFSHQVDLHALRVETGADQRLTAHSRENMFPSFSPDGRKLLYQSDRTGNNEIWLLDFETKAERNLTNHRGDDLVPDWSPDGREIAFVSNREGTHQVWVMDVEAGSLRRLAEQTVPATLGWNVGKVAPRWSPDGKSIGYVAVSDRGNALWVADRDGRNARPRLYGLLYFDWYRDSRRVIYVRPAETGFTDVRAADLESGQEVVLLKEPAIELLVSPDGRSVAYTHAASHFSMNLYVLPLQWPASAAGLPRAAGPPKQLTNGRAQWHVHQAAWSPDGKTIVYTRDADQGDIYVIENYR